MTKRKRKRGQSLSEDGIAAVRHELDQRDWSLDMLVGFSGLSPSTITRMLRGDRVDRDSLNAALGVLGLEVDVWTESIQSLPPTEALTSPAITPSVLPPISTLYSFYMNATFLDTNLLQIRCVLTALKKELIDSRVKFHLEGDDIPRITVSGVFAPEKKSAIEATVSHLESLLLTCTLTGDLKCADCEEPLQIAATAIAQ